MSIEELVNFIKKCLKAFNERLKAFRLNIKIGKTTRKKQQLKIKITVDSSNTSTVIVCTKLTD